MVKTLCELVKIPSESPNDREFIAYMQALLEKEGAKTELDSYGNLIAKFPAKNSSSKESLFFCCHADTVKPGVGIKPIVESNIIKSDGTTILGGDDKAGIAEVLEMLKIAKKHPPIEFIIVRCEEILPSGAEFLDTSLLDSKYGYIIDMDEPRELVIGGPTYIVITAKIKGRTAHSGMAPEKGISAIHCACKAITELRLGRLDPNTTANVGIIRGGQNMNSIPEETEVVAECRSTDDKTAWAVAEEMKRTFQKVAKEFGAEVTVEFKTSLKAYSIPKDSKVVQIAVSAMKKHGVEPDVKIITAGTDAAHLNQKGLLTGVLGMGVHMMHGLEEYAVISEMEQTVKIITTIVEELA